MVQQLSLDPLTRFSALIESLSLAGIIDNWDHMEKYWHRCLYQYLNCDPEEHYMLLVPHSASYVQLLYSLLTTFLRVVQTEPPMNTPENRELTAEIMFETFNVPGLYIAVQVPPYRSTLCAVLCHSAVRPPSLSRPFSPCAPVC